MVIPPPVLASLRKSAKATSSSVRRYPRHVFDSVRDACLPRSAIVPCIDLASFTSHPLAACWIGHASVLLRVGAQTILTDPVFSHRIGMRVGGVTLGVPRLVAPAVDVDHLPQIDIVLISHAHFDHLDRPSLQRLAAGPAKGASVITAAQTRRLIPPGFAEVVELPWDRRIRCRDLRFSACKPAHWGARTAIDHHRGFNSYLIEHAASAARVFFAGDTAATDAFKRIGPTDLSIFGIGAYDPWEHAHATPEQVWSMFIDQSQGRSALLPMHHSTFALGREPVDEPLNRLFGAASSSAHRIVATRIGSLWTPGAG